MIVDQYKIKVTLFTPWRQSNNVRLYVHVPKRCIPARQSVKFSIKVKKANIQIMSTKENNYRIFSFRPQIVFRCTCVCAKQKLKAEVFTKSPHLNGRKGGFDPATSGLYASSGVFFKYIIWKKKTHIVPILHATNTNHSFMHTHTYIHIFLMEFWIQYNSELRYRRQIKRANFTLVEKSM